MVKAPSVGEALRRAYKSPKACPVATHDVKTNLANRNNTIKEYGYGPMNPLEPSAPFWKRLAKMWDTTTEEAQKSRCDNCSAFIQTKEMLACIEKGIGFDPDEPPENNKAEAVSAVAVTTSANLGYCQLFHFKCAGDRTCDAWLVGGPIR